MIENLSLFGYWKRCYTKYYATFSGRARRSEYWGFALFQILISLPIALYYQSAVFAQAFAGAEPGIGFAHILYYAWILVTFLPGLAVTVRRLHDSGRSGWNVLVALIPLIGAILVFVWLCADTRYGQNQYGPDPKYPQE